MAYSYENELNALKKAQTNAAIADLSNTKNQTLSDLTTEQAKNTANFANQRKVANVQNRIGNKNFQEYLASTGRANTGLAAQAKLSSRNNLNTQLNNIYGAENAAKADINRRITNANNTYNSGLTAANANIEANYITNLLDQRYKAQQQANDERDFNERVRQFNAQLYSNFNSGSRNNNSASNDQWLDTPVVETNNNQAQNNTVHTGGGFGENGYTSATQSTNINAQNQKVYQATKVGQRYVKLVQLSNGAIVSQLWEKGKKGDKRIA